MNSPFRGVPLRTRAIELLKQGHTADAIHVMFVNEGQDPNEVRSVLTDLVALQHQAAAMDPKRLREEAKWMLFRGASVDDVVAHFVRVGVPEEHARPEAQRMSDFVQKFQPCQRCGTPTAPDQFFMDLSGFNICRGCNLRDEIGRSEQRGIAREIDAIGGGFAGSMASSMIAYTIAADAERYHGGTSRPFCAQCRQPTGIHVAWVDPRYRATVDPTATWICHQCGRKIT
jgi:hypothetical protein